MFVGTGVRGRGSCVYGKTWIWIGHLERVTCIGSMLPFTAHAAKTVNREDPGVRMGSDTFGESPAVAQLFTPQPRATSYQMRYCILQHSVLKRERGQAVCPFRHQ